MVSALTQTGRGLFRETIPIEVRTPMSNIDSNNNKSL